MFDADRPIKNSSEDRLDRTQFATYLARSLLDQQTSQSVVVGLFGGWGAGKSSIINLIIEELNFASSNMLEEEQPIVLRFDPWNYSGQQHMIQSFYRRFKTEIDDTENLKYKEQIIFLLELCMTYLTEEGSVTPIKAKRRSLWDILTFRNRDLIIDDTLDYQSCRDLVTVKEKLNELLEKENRRIIIIIENVSRIYDYEIKQLFQIVKSIADYSNTSYLLSVNKKKLIEKLDGLDGSGGEELLNKVVQLPFEIPPISHHDVENILADRLMDIVKTVPEDSWNSEYWADIYYSSLKFYFKSCRDITRYINTLSFGYSRLRELVNPVDYFALTALEVFYPKIYEGIRDNRDLFTDLLDSVYEPDSDQADKEISRCEEIMKREPSASRELILELLLRLFPHLRHLYEPHAQSYHSSAVARKAKRVCAPDLFDVYFRLYIPSSGMPISEFNTIMAMASDQVEFDHALTRLNQDNRIPKLIDLFDRQTIRKIPEDNIPAIISALLDNGDLFPAGISGPLSLDTAMHIHRIITDLLLRIDDTDQRFEILKDAIIKSTKSIYIIVNEMNEQTGEHIEEEDTYLPKEFRVLQPNQLQILKTVIAEKIEYWAEHCDLQDHPKLLPILAAWREWGSKNSCEKYVAEITKTDRGIIAFLASVLDNAIGEVMRSYDKKSISWEKYLEEIRHFIEPELLEKHAKELFEDEYFEKLREREQLALMIFLDLMKSQTQKTIPKTSPN